MRMLRERPDGDSRGRRAARPRRLRRVRHARGAHHHDRRRAGLHRPEAGRDGRPREPDRRVTLLPRHAARRRSAEAFGYEWFIRRGAPPSTARPASSPRSPSRSPADPSARMSVMLLDLPRRQPRRCLVHVQRVPAVAAAGSSLGVSFFAGWLTGELALFHLAWQVVATVVFVWLGALDAWPGLVGLVITSRRGSGSCGSSWSPCARRRRHGGRAARGLGERLPRHRSRRASPSAWRRRPSTLQLLFPFYLRDRAVERIKNIQYAPGAGRRHRLDVYRPRAGVEGAPGAAPDPRRRLDHRRQERSRRSR